MRKRGGESRFRLAVGARFGLQPELEAIIRERCVPFSSEPTDRFVSYFRGRFGPPLRAVVAYGSMLSDVTAKATSIFDFFLLTANYHSFHPSIVHAILNPVLPPNVYEVKIDAPPLGRLACKYSTVTLWQLGRETSQGSFDLYHAGRFSKRFGLCWAATEEVASRVVRAAVRATMRMGLIALPRLPERFSVEQFSRELLGLSYLADKRVEASDKVERIYRAEEDYYRRLHRALLDSWSAEPRSALRRDKERYCLSLAAGERQRLLHRGEHLIRMSRLRGQARWPKYLFTYKNWVDYLISKIERAQGVRIELTERERRYPLLTAFRHYRTLRRDHMVK